MRILVSLLLCLCLSQPLWAATKPVENLPANYESAKKGPQPEVVNPKKVILVPGSSQEVKKEENKLTIEYERIHPSGKFPEVSIQGIPFKMTSKGDKLEFTWQKAGYSLVWPGEDDKVILQSSEAFAVETFSTQDKKAKSQVIHVGLKVETKRNDGKMALLEVTEVEKEKSGVMNKFSVKTHAAKEDKDFQNENNIPAPPVHKQYEKGVNGEVLFIFTSNKKGEILVYYR